MTSNEHTLHYTQKPIELIRTTKLANMYSRSKEKRKSSVSTQPVFESMDDIKPAARGAARGVTAILKRPPPVAPPANTNAAKASSSAPTDNINTAASWTEVATWDTTPESNKYTPTPPKPPIQQQPQHTTGLSSYSNSSENSPYDNTAKPRTRNNTFDTVGLVKVTASVGKFEDIKSEAMNSWEEGVDVKLGVTDVKKKPKEWLSQSVFFSDKFSATSPPSNDSNENVSPEWLQETTPNPNRKTYAEATHQLTSGRKTPEWATTKTTPQEAHMAIPFGYNQQGWSPQAAAIPHPLAPMMMMPSPYMQMPHPMLPPTSQRDDEYYRYLFITIRDKNNVSVLTALQKRISKIFQRYLPEFSPRTFAILLEAVAHLLEYEASLNQSETARRIREASQFFIYFATRHLRIYAKNPDDLLSVLRICTHLQRYSPKIHKDLPMADIVRVYELIKDMCTPESLRECNTYLRLLKVIHDTDSTLWPETDDQLPSVPSAEDIMVEVVNKTNVLLDYETKKEIYIVNKVHNSWPDVIQYVRVHFMLLREELLKPIQNTIDALFSGNESQPIELPHDCSMFEHTVPKSTTMTVASSETAIVFQLGPALQHDDIMESFEEGSFVFMFPESQTALNPSDQHQTLMNLTKKSMMGRAIRASSYGKSRLASIHIRKEDINRLDWSASYTIITCPTNAASSLSVLSWLRKEYVDFKKERFSSALTPRILAANNTLSAPQFKAWYTENIEEEKNNNQVTVPYYLMGTEVDVSCLMVNRGTYKARPADDIWPRHGTHWENMPHSKRPPLYSISPSQLSAIKFALTHRIAVISGAPGTGKTFIAAKLAQLMSQALNAGQYHQPLLIISKTQSCLDTILSQVMTAIPDIVRFGGETWDEALVEKQAIRLVTPSVSDSNYHQHQQLERQLSKNQAKLNSLFVARFQASEHDPAVLCTAISPEYLKLMQQGYMQKYNQSYPPNHVVLWSKWAAEDKKTKNYPKAKSEHTNFEYAQWLLESCHLKKAGRGMMPLLDPNYMQNRFTGIANNPVTISSIVDSTHWPFETSTLSSKDLRSKLANVWQRLSKNEIWTCSESKRTQIIEALSQVLVTSIDYEIQEILQDQIKTAKAYDENLVQKLTSVCRFNRVIGITADFAAAHRDWISTLWPRAIIVDEASEILESTLASFVLGARAEHLVLLGNSDNLSKPHLSNIDMSGNPRNLDVSLFERWKKSGSGMVLLEEQWRMCSGVADVIDKFNSMKDESASLLITAPIASCNENKVDGSKPQEEIMYGITQRAFYLDYQVQGSAKQSEKYSKICKKRLTMAEVDEARFIAFFAVYLSQQRHPKPNITILTVCLVQKYLIRNILRDEVPNRTVFRSNVSKISIDTVEQNGGRQDSFTIISTATPAKSFSNMNNVSFALTRARYGLFVIGKPERDDVHERWKDFAKYMKSRDLYGTHLQLSCYEHGDTFSVSKWQDFDLMRNGGCSKPCETLMNDGHRCPEVCHFLSHDQVICHEACNRLRPTLCQHECKKKCFECSTNGSCPPCEEMTTVTLDCGHTITGVCHSLQRPDELECQVNVNVQLSCGHDINIECYKSKDPKYLVCQTVSQVDLECGHTVDAKCGETAVCGEICNQFYECGHACVEICGIEHSHARKECTATCPKRLICGHGCANGCANPDKHTEHCIATCNYICSHGYKCSRECWKDCIKCVSACPWTCTHFRCNKKCFEVCDRPPCNKACRSTLSCGHKCSGLCGEPCPPCSTCNGNLKCSISLRTLSEFEMNEKIYVLPECGCVFSVESLDMYFLNQSKNGAHTAVKLWGCPTCQKTIYRAYRYNKFIKTEINLVNTIKLQIEKSRQKLTLHEKSEIINAMNDETKQGPHNLVGGRWFVCNNQHPYFVGDCGGATEISKCPECEAPIGGTQHRVIESNRFYGEFDGSLSPAWPGQPGTQN